MAKRKLYFWDSILPKLDKIVEYLEESQDDLCIMENTYLEPCLDMGTPEFEPKLDKFMAVVGRLQRDSTDLKKEVIKLNHYFAPVLSHHKKKRAPRPVKRVKEREIAGA